MTFLYDLLPIALFFIAYKLYGIYAATGVAIAAVVLQLIHGLVKKKKPDMMQMMTLGLVVILGGSTLLFRNELFIKWKPTALYWALGIVFGISQWVAKKNLVQKMLEKSLTLPTEAWSKLNCSWVSFFMMMGALNLYVVYRFDTDTWVNFKLFGTLVLTILFVILQGVLISRYLPKNQ